MSFQELKAIGLANPKGKIVSNNATGNDVNNCGSWERTDCIIDVQEDLMKGIARLNNIPGKILMHPNTYSNFIQGLCYADNGYERLYSFGAICGCPPHDRSWLDVNDSYEDGIVLIIARSQDPYGGRGPDPAIVYIDTR